MSWIRFVPMDAPTGNRKSYSQSRYRASYSNTMNLLRRELEHLSASSVLLEAHFQANEIRNDGFPRSSARPSFPDVRLSFKSKVGPLSFEGSTYDNWEDNLRAIALTMELLRDIERYGVVKGAQQYRGFKALPDGNAQPQSTSGTITPYQAAMLRLSLYAEISTDAFKAMVAKGYEGAREMYREASRRCHPDAGGSNEAMCKVNEAWRVIQTHYGK